MRHSLQHLLVLLIALVTLSAQAGDIRYQANLEDSRWQTTSSSLKCTLSHTVEPFGEAQFYQLAGFQPRFRFYANQRPIRAGQVKLTSVAPEWKQGEFERDLGQHRYQAGQTPFRFKRELSLRLLSELEQGMMPTLQFKDWGDGRDDVSVALSTVRFRQALGQYRDCTRQIIPYDFNKVRNTRVYFASAKSGLSSKAKRQLDAVIAYLTRDPSVKRAIVEGHADALGNHVYNNELSEQRAFAVRQYLLQNNVPESKLLVRYFGKRKPATTNRTQKGRALNRRVKIELIRE